MLWPAAVAQTEARYYVSKYLREDFGTPAQLEAGLRDHAQPTPTPPAVLERLLRAWRAMQPAAQDAPAVYQVGGEWKAIVAEAFRPLTTTLDAGDEAALDHLLRNFMRHFGDFSASRRTSIQKPTTGGTTSSSNCSSRAGWICSVSIRSPRQAWGPLISNPMGFVIGGHSLHR